MVVSQQIDAMRSLGTDPIRKLVTPRILALVFTLPLLVIIADILGLIGAAIVAKTIFGLDYNAFISTARVGIQTDDIIGGILKPIVFGFIIGCIACRKGLSTNGGTVGVGRSTTIAVVLSSIYIIIVDFFLSRIIQVFLKDSW
jgi:phospholipid/cholesterol/gamma-HCH transport system permease protein